MSVKEIPGSRNRPNLKGEPRQLEVREGAPEQTSSSPMDTFTCPEGLELVATCTFLSVVPAHPGTCSVMWSSDCGGRIKNSHLNRWSQRNLDARADQLAEFDARTDDFAPSSRFPGTASTDSICGETEHQARPVPPWPPSPHYSNADDFMQPLWTWHHNCTGTSAIWQENVQTMQIKQTE